MIQSKLGTGQQTPKKTENLGKFKTHKNRVERPKKKKVEKLPLFKTQRRRNMVNAI